MRLLKVVFDFYINSSIHVALAVYSFVRITEVYFNLSYNEPLNYVIFYGTITGYNFIKYAEIAKFKHKKLNSKLKVIQVFSLISFLLMCFYGYKLAVKTLFLLFPFGLLTLLYAVPFLKRFQQNLRSINFLKIIIVAFVWAGVTVLIPQYDAGLNVFKTKSILLFIQRFLLVIVLVLPFDIRDVKYDAISLQTLPKRIGVKNTKLIGVFLLIICLFLELFIKNMFLLNESFFLIIFIIFFLLIKASEKQSKYYSSFIVEAIPIIWWFFLSFF